MDKNSKILFYVLIVLLVASIFFTYYRSFITKDFTILENSEEELSSE
ncbi:MAG: hypothetical protein WC822_04190 [Candidatus Paceibacterota bacterium]|jgi:hypothetical protein